MSRAFPKILMMAAVFSAAILFAGCKKEEAVEAAPEEAAQPAADYSKWVGLWDGPEGTSLELKPGEGGNYNLIIKNLDGPIEFIAQPQAEGLGFERNGVEIIRHGSGLDTGMKYLLDKNDCLYIQIGEGYCRD